MDDPGDPEAAGQRPIARRVLTESPSLFVPIAVVLELEGVPRAYCRFDPGQVIRVFEHLLGLAEVNSEESKRVAAALPLPLAVQGPDLADALQLAGRAHCAALCAFDDGRFARRVHRLAGVVPARVPNDTWRPVEPPD